MNTTQTPSVANHIISAVLTHVRSNKDSLVETNFASRSRQPSRGDAPTFDPNADTSVLHVGLDWGATKTVLKASFAGSTELVIDQSIPTVVGIAKAGLVEGILPNNATTLFGHEALAHRRHLHLTNPSLDSAAATEFARHLRAQIDGLNLPRETEVRAVIAAPAGIEATQRDEIRRNLCEHFQSVILLPAPFLAALGHRDESRLTNADYSDPARNSIFVDLGASATTLCLVQGYYPAAEDQLTLDFGGNHIDQLLRAAILEEHPDAELSPITVRLLKEKHACVGEGAASVCVNIIVAGKPTTLDLTREITTACGELLTRVHAAIKDLFKRTECEILDASKPQLPEIILTGGVSGIKNFAEELRRALLAEGYANPRVSVAMENSRSVSGLVAVGALKAARQAREHHWQQVTR